MLLETIKRQNSYITPEGISTVFSRLFPSISHYTRQIKVVISASLLVDKGVYDPGEWVKSSQDSIRSIEKTGTTFYVEGLEHFKEIEEPCVFIGNHMSTLETFALPCMIEPFKSVTFVVKESLLKYPFFGKVLASCNPIVVGRVSPRDDLSIMFKEGQKRLEQGISIIVFPQSTRSFKFDLTAFNSIGIKLARRAGVAIVPVAVKTDVWGMGSFLKDFGSIVPSRDVHFKFGSPIKVEGNGKREHDLVCDFISKELKGWGVETISAIDSGKSIKVLSE